MSKPVTAKRILTVLDIADWSGHVEIGDSDKAWIATLLADALNPPKDKMRCDSCGDLQPIVIRTPIGLICEECLDVFAEQASEARDNMESP